MNYVFILLYENWLKILSRHSFREYFSNWNNRTPTFASKISLVEYWKAEKNYHWLGVEILDVPGSEFTCKLIIELFSPTPWADPERMSGPSFIRGVRSNLVRIKLRTLEILYVRIKSKRHTYDGLMYYRSDVRACTYRSVHSRTQHFKHTYTRP